MGDRKMSNAAGGVTVVINDKNRSFIKIILHETNKGVQRHNFIERDKLETILNDANVDVLDELKKELDVCPFPFIFFCHKQDRIIFCFADEAIEQIIKQEGLFDVESYEKMKIKCIRTPNPWTDMKSDADIFELQALNQRPLRTVEAIVPIQAGVRQKLLDNAPQEKLSSASFSSSSVQAKLLIRRTVDVNLQASSSHDVKIQTTLNLPNKMWTQWEPQTREFPEILMENHNEMFNKILKAVHNNSMLNIYSHDYVHLRQINKEKTAKNLICTNKLIDGVEENVLDDNSCCTSWHTHNRDILSSALEASNKHSLVSPELSAFQLQSAPHVANVVIHWDGTSQRLQSRQRAASARELTRRESEIYGNPCRICRKTIQRSKKHVDRLLKSASENERSRREQGEVRQLTAKLQSCDIGARKDAQRSLQLLTDHPQNLLQLKKIDKNTLLKAQTPIVELEEQDWRKKEIQKRRVNEISNDLNTLQDRIFQQPSKSEDIEFRPKGASNSKASSADTYFEQFKILEQSISSSWLHK